jgi:hypothetical protein
MVIPAVSGGGVEKGSGESFVFCPVRLIATLGSATDAPDEGSGSVR